jgi:hypothetical protein
MANTLSELISERAGELIQALSVPAAINLDPNQLVAACHVLLDHNKSALEQPGNSFVVPRNSDLPYHLRVSFNNFLVEPLLREASLLLDRCVQQRRDINDLNSKWFEARLQIVELILLNDISRMEEENLLPLIVEIADLSKDLINNDVEIAKELHTLYSTLQNTIRTRYPDDTHPQPEEQPMHVLARFAVFDAQNRQLPQNSQDFARFTTDFNSRMQSANVAQELVKLRELETVTDKHRTRSEKSVELEEQRKRSQALRNDVSRLVALNRAEQLIAKQGALNFGEQMVPIQERFDNDFLAAWFRLAAAATGLRKLYGYEIDNTVFPQQNGEILTHSDNQPELRISFDSLVSWTQRTNVWLASFLDTQQQTTRSFSLLQLLNNDQALFDAGKETGVWDFRLTENDFHKSKFVRMRSFACQIDSEHPFGSWNVAITPPSSALIRRSEGDPQPIQQSHIGTLYMGRVNERIYAVVPEGSAPPKLYNASPIGDETDNGKWIISVFAGSTAGASLNDIQDIDIHLTVSLI